MKSRLLELFDDSNLHRWLGGKARRYAIKKRSLKVVRAFFGILRKKNDFILCFESTPRLVYTWIFGNRNEFYRINKDVTAADSHCRRYSRYKRAFLESV